MSGEKTALLLLAAGLSSRMGDFKPLMELGDKPLIDHALDTFGTVPICETVIVTGHRHDEIESHLSGRGIIFIRNERYAKTDMLDSIKAGLAYLEGRCDRFFVMPADIPLVRPFCAEEMLAGWPAQPYVVLKPTYRGKSGHPLLIGAECISRILAYEGKNGLKGALEDGDFRLQTLSLPDPGLWMDADTPAGMDAIRNYYKEMGIPSNELALEILAWRDVGGEITRHSIEVAKLAVSLARRAQSRGFNVDPRLVEACALLHDVERKSGRDHARNGSALLYKMGYGKVAAIVGAHMELPADALGQVDECAIVYLADKLTMGDRRVGINARREAAMLKYALDKDAADAINKRMEDAAVLMERLGLDGEKGLNDWIDC